MRGAGSAQINTNTHLIKTARPDRLLLTGTERHWQTTGHRRRERERKVSVSLFKNNAWTRNVVWLHTETLKCKRYDIIVQVNAKKKNFELGLVRLNWTFQLVVAAFVILVIYTSKSNLCRMWKSCCFESVTQDIHPLSSPLKSKIVATVDVLQTHS